MPTPRVLLGMFLGAVVAALGALFLGEYEFDEWLPILSGALLGLIVAEVVVSVGKLRSLALAVTVAVWAATAVVLAGMLDANETEPVKWGAYLSAALAALAAMARVNEWRRPKGTSSPEETARTESRADERTTPAPAGTIVPSSPTRLDERDGRSVRRRPAEGARRPEPRPGPSRSQRPAEGAPRPAPTRSRQPAPQRNPPADRRLPSDEGPRRPSRPRPAPRAPIADEEWMEQPAPPRIPSGPAPVRASARRLQPTDEGGRSVDGQRPARRRDDDAPVREPRPRSRRTDRGR